ncbi:MAG: polyprenyl synthetase family protein [Candidatus Hadarchaeaceae archaeon]
MDFFEFIEETRAEIDNALRRLISSRDDRRILWELIEGGKRLRPLLCILSFRVCGGADENYGGALDVAAAVELGHCASLCHDDIVDRDLTRRGKPALWVEDGIPEALMAGHRAISLGLQISLTQGIEIAETFLEAWDRSVKGGLREIEVRRGQRNPVASYSDIIAEKTGRLFSAASKVGSQVARAPHDLQELMEDYGAAVGVAYQIADDLSELHEGKAGELSTMMELASKPEEVTSLREFLKGKMEAAIKRAENLSRDVGIPESEFKPLLSQVPRYFVSQILGEVMG